MRYLVTGTIRPRIVKAPSGRFTDHTRIQNKYRYQEVPDLDTAERVALDWIESDKVDEATFEPVR